MQEGAIQANERVRRQSAGGIESVATTSADFGHVVVGDLAVPWILMISERTVAIPNFLRYVGIAHFGIGQDRQIVELDAVVLAGTDQLVDAVDGRFRRSRPAARE